MIRVMLVAVTNAHTLFNGLETREAQVYSHGKSQWQFLAGGQLFSM